MMPSRPRAPRGTAWLPGLTLALALACFGPPALAGTENPANTPEIHAVHLDMPLVKRLVAVQKVTDKIEDAPPLYTRTKENKVPKTLDELVAEVHTCPPLEAAIKAQGFTPREYLAASLAFVDALFGYGFRLSGDEQYLKGQDISEAHMAFIKAHYKELTAEEIQ